MAKNGQKISVQSLTPPDNEGWMTKQGGSWKSWKRRWFILKGTSLYYFKTKTDDNVTGIIELTNQSFVRKDDSKKTKKYTIQVATSKTTDRIFLMYPDTESEMNSWIKSIQAVIDKLQGTSAPKVDNTPTKQAPTKVEEPPAGQDTPMKLEGVRKRLDEGKNTVSFLFNEDSKVLEFWQIWLESIPSQRDITEGSIVFEVYTAADMEKLSWRSSGPQNIFIQKMVDFFWNVGAPETEIDRLNDVGALINPITIGSWIDMSAKGGMDGGWFFPVDVPMKFALEACDPGEPVTKVADWTEEKGISRCNYVGRDMGAAPPRQTEIRFLVGGETFDEQFSRALSAYDVFNFPQIPEDAISIIREWAAPGLQLSVITSSEGFVRLGLMVPSPPRAIVEKLCVMSGTGNPENLFRFEGAVGCEGPSFVEFQYLMPGFGYGVYKEAFDVVFHYRVGEEVRS
eukprot:TRINITY_DN3_c1_g1_i1.p1 TRINITY_DN3_c1_g1~~TRINITY_DN3_c1_g1_i1.p1  ORF type:complete len:454 (-),score=121.73 TRINITY_DN3_c1_g1_i1:418-1779(-)